MKVLICGGRNYSDAGKLNARLEALRMQVGIDEEANPWPLVIVHGGASGADRLAERWASSHGIPSFACVPAWGVYGKGAGPIRNGWMLSLFMPDRVLAFPGGHGTADCVRQAKALSIHVEEIE